ncbi:MAG: hypothetical protein COA42_14275 [Alteromonadaceae bacterium]|nr:MAG: hypothetical protein COA42_14275 [Alteromonadaceae bacterium]
MKKSHDLQGNALEDGREDIPKEYSRVLDKSAFSSSVRPRLSRLLRTAGLDAVYERGEGDLLYLSGSSAEEQPVLDLVGGFGASLFGHNHPVLVKRAIQLLEHRRPFNNQARVRNYAGLLSEKLAEKLQASTGKEYMVTLASTGAEAIEAAIKHAELESVQRRDSISSEIKRSISRLEGGVRTGRYILPECVFEDASQLIGKKTPTCLETLCLSISQFNERQLSKPSVFLSLEGAFHGKTSGALKLTHNPEFRDPWRNMGISVVFMPINDIAAAEKIVSTHGGYYVDVVILECGEVSFVRRDISTISGCFIEPIQGEGGIRAIDSAYMRVLRTLATNNSFPLIVDEIQTMGRTGTFVATEHLGAHGDYYTFSKALGGGLAKISALLIEKSRYIEKFGYLHTSSFADDCFSSAIGLGVLELLEIDDGALLEACRTKGDYLKQGLLRVQQACPDAIANVRGHGLMLGVELQSQENSNSPLLRILNDQTLLGFVVCGFLLNEMGVRVSPTVSAHNVIQIKPSAYITQQQMDHCIVAFRLVAELIQRGDSLRLCGFLAGRKMMTLPATKIYQDTPIIACLKGMQVDHQVAFLVHYLEPFDLALWEQNFYPLSSEDCSAFLDSSLGVLSPFIVKEQVLVSNLDTRIGVTVVGIPMSSKQFLAAMNAGDITDALDMIRDAVEIAKTNGAEIVGFGGYTSIITNNCTNIEDDSVGFTSGNSLTAAATIDALLQVAEEHGVNIHSAKLGIVGATGNIGKVLAEVLADEVGSITLVSRNRGTQRLNRLANTIYKQKLDKNLLNSNSGIDKTIVASKTYQRKAEFDNDWDGFRQAIEQELAANCPITIESDLGALKDCDLIVCATNTAQPLVFPEHVGDNPVIICDVATPGDVSPSVISQKPNALVINGGVIALPKQQTVEIQGVALDDGNVYACMAETIILGMSGMNANFSHGALQPAKVRQIRELAKRHGFVFSVQISKGQ